MSRILRAFGIDTESGQGAAIISGYTGEAGEVHKGAIAFLVDLFHKARTIGVRFTLEDIAAMHPVEREAARLAGERWEAAQALLIGRSTKGGLDAAAVAAIIDGGELLAEAYEEVDRNIRNEVRVRTAEVLANHRQAFVAQRQRAAG